MSRIALITHTHPETLGDAVQQTVNKALEHGHQLISNSEDWRKYQPDLEIVGREASPLDVDLCLVLGGDGTVLYALRHYANTDVPVFAINHGTMGFLTAAEQPDLLPALEQAFTGEFETVSLPALEIANSQSPSRLAFNDIALSRPDGGRIAELHYQVAGEEVGSVRCDGLVVATPTGSTGYNLANNGPILAWGVQGYVVSYISPHSLTARPLVVAPNEILTVSNAPGRQAVNVELDGDCQRQLDSGQSLDIIFHPQAGLLAQSNQQNFYGRIQAKFGHLAT